MQREICLGLIVAWRSGGGQAWQCRCCLSSWQHWSKWIPRFSSPGHRLMWTCTQSTAACCDTGRGERALERGREAASSLPAPFGVPSTSPQLGPSPAGPRPEGCTRSRGSIGYKWSPRWVCRGERGRVSENLVCLLLFFSHLSLAANFFATSFCLIWCLLLALLFFFFLFRGC